MKRAIRWEMMAIMLVVASAGQGRANFINGGFETGDLSGWTISGPPDALVTVETSVSELVGSQIGTYLPAEGSYFGYLMTLGNAGIYTMLSQEFTANADDMLTLQAFFDTAEEISESFSNDDGYVRLINASDSSYVTLFARSASQVGDFGSTPWTSIEHTFLAGGTFRIEAGVRNVFDNGTSSALGVDIVSLESTDDEVSAVPEPASMALLGFASIGGIGLRLRRRQRAKETQAAG